MKNSGICLEISLKREDEQMNKENIKNILMSIRNPDNEHIVNYLLGQVDVKED